MNKFRKKAWDPPRLLPVLCEHALRRACHKEPRNNIFRYKSTMRTVVGNHRQPSREKDSGWVFRVICIPTFQPANSFANRQQLRAQTGLRPSKSFRFLNIFGVPSLVSRVMKLVLAGDFGGTFTVNRSGAKQSGVVARNNHLRPINLWIVVSHFPSFHAQKN